MATLYFYINMLSMPLQYIVLASCLWIWLQS